MPCKLFVTINPLQVIEFQHNYEPLEGYTNKLEMIIHDVKPVDSPVDPPVDSPFYFSSDKKIKFLDKLDITNLLYKFVAYLDNKLPLDIIVSQFGIKRIETACRELNSGIQLIYSNEGIANNYQEDLQHTIFLNTFSVKRILNFRDLILNLLESGLNNSDCGCFYSPTRSPILQECKLVPNGNLCLNPNLYPM